MHINQIIIMTLILQINWQGNKMKLNINNKEIKRTQVQYKITSQIKRTLKALAKDNLISKILQIKLTICI